MNEFSPPVGGGNEQYAACDAAGAPSEVTQAQLDELNIAVTWKGEE